MVWLKSGNNISNPPKKYVQLYKQILKTSSGIFFFFSVILKDPKGLKKNFGNMKLGENSINLYCL